MLYMTASKVIQLRVKLQTDRETILDKTSDLHNQIPSLNNYESELETVLLAMPISFQQF